MSLPLNHLPSTQHMLRRGMFLALAVVCMALLGGCSVWPKALTFTSDQGPAPLEETPATAPLFPAVAAAAPAAVAAPSAVATPTKVDTPQPMKVQPLPAAPADPLPPPKAAAAATPTIVMQPQRATPAAGLVRGFYINAGLFAVPTNGISAYRKLESAGLPVFSDAVSSKKGTLTRLRVGPYSTRAQADAAVKKIRALQLDANVFKH
jgi:cell division septation protein DedD